MRGGVGVRGLCPLVFWGALLYFNKRRRGNAMKLLKYPHTEPTVKAVSGTTAAVDEERSFIYGLAENYSSIGDYV